MQMSICTEVKTVLTFSAEERGQKTEEVNSRLSNIVLGFNSFDPFWDEKILKKTFFKTLSMFLIYWRMNEISSMQFRPRGTFLCYFCHVSKTCKKGWLIRNGLIAHIFCPNYNLRCYAFFHAARRLVYLSADHQLWATAGAWVQQTFHAVHDELNQQETGH